MAQRKWKPFGTKAPKELADARLQLHHAAQIIASTAITHRKHEPDDSHSNMGYEDGALVARSFGPDDALSARLHLVEGMIELRGPAGDAARISLAGRTQQSACDRLAEAIGAAWQEKADPSLTKPDYELPDHAFANGAPYTPDHESLIELDKWYANADLVLRAVTGDVPEGESASSVRTWPHHFDIGAIISLDPGSNSGSDSDSARSIGIGLSPGDDTYAEPYFYTRAYPSDQKRNTPSIAAPGFWHTDGWHGMILRARDLVRESNPERTARRHLAETVPIARSLLEASS